MQTGLVKINKLGLICVVAPHQNKLLGRPKQQQVFERPATGMKTPRSHPTFFTLPAIEKKHLIRWGNPATLRLQVIQHLDLRHMSGYITQPKLMLGPELQFTESAMAADTRIN